MPIDLRTDAKEIRELIARQVEAFAGLSLVDNPGPRVSAVEIGFEFDQSGWFFLHFDTRETHDRDGEWTMFLGTEPYRQDLLARAHWYEEICNGPPGPTNFILADGTPYEMPHGVSEQDVARFLGEFIKGIVLSAKEEGVFEKLPRFETCQIDIEEFNGNWSWPEYEELGKVNLI